MKEQKNINRFFGKDFKKIVKGCKKFWFSFPEVIRYICTIVFFISMLLIILSLSIEFYYSVNSNYINSYECNQLRIDDVNYYLGLQETNPYLAFIYAWATPIKFMLIAIGLAWIIHGVGFHIIKR